MPFIKKHHAQGAFTAASTRAIFVGRTKELLFLAQQILKPEEPSHNILSIWGQAGVGKTTLLRHFISQAQTAEFKEYCLTALVDERQATPASMMEKFARQLPFSKKFEQALNHYQEALNFLTYSKPGSRMPTMVVSKAPDVAGALFEAVPMAGPLLREGAKMATEHLLEHSQRSKGNQVAIQLHGPLKSLTRAFIAELNQLATAKVTLPSGRTKRERRILLFFDTFEQLADEAVPWLLEDVLELDIHPTIVLIVAGRDPIERAGSGDPKLWLPYYDAHTLYAIPLYNFTQEETSAYLTERGVISLEQQETIWHLSQGLPLYLGFLTANAQGKIDPTKDVVDNFLRWIPEQEATKRHLALDAALFSRPFNLDDLEAFSYLSEQERPALYSWLIRQPFVRPSSLEGRYVYHDLAQELFCRHLSQRSPKAYYTAREALTEHYQRVLEYLQTVQERHSYGPTEERLQVMLALVSQRLFLPDEASHLQALLPCIDILEYEDKEQEQVLMKALQGLLHRPSSMLMSAHASQVLQGLLRWIETFPPKHLTTDHHQRQEWLQATDHLLKLASKTSSPSSAVLSGIYDQCGWGYSRLGEDQQALACFERALALDPSSGKTYNGLGQMRSAHKEYLQAIDDFKHALELIPHHPHVYRGRGRMYYWLKAYQQALNDLDHALQLDRRYLIGYSNRSLIYMALKEHHKALADVDHILEAAPGHPLTGRAQLQRGCIYLWLKDTSQAIDCFTRGYEVALAGALFSWQRNWSSVTRDLFLWAREWSAMCQGYPDAQTVQRLETIAGGDTYTTCVCRGVLFWLHNEFEQARAVFQHATTLHHDPDWEDFGEAFWQEWDAHFWLGMAYLALNQEEEARSAIAQALAFEMPPILLKPLCWFEQERPELCEKFVKPLLETYEVSW